MTQEERAHYQEDKLESVEQESEATVKMMQQPSFLDGFFDKSKEIILSYFTGGNTLVRT